MAEKFEVLSDRQHVLLRPTIMIGSVTPEPMHLYIDGKYQEVTVTPGLLCIAREICDNSVDEFVKSGMTAANKITINMTSNYLEVIDNGRGIPIEMYEDKEQGISGYRPELAWTRLRAGSNFSGERVSVGQNGVGSSVAAILSKTFIGETWNNGKYFKLTCSDNMEKINTFCCNKQHLSGTRVYIEPDFSRFGVDSFTEYHIKVTKERILSLASIFPEITFTFNGEKILSKKPKDYLAIYNKKYVLQNGENYFFAIMPSELEEYYCNSFIGGLWIRNGGIHEQYISRELCNSLREVIKRKYKLEMMPAEIKRGLFLVFNARFFPNLKFDSQTKERLTNSEAEVKDYLGDIDFAKLARQISEIPEIIEPIIEAKLAKQIAAEKRAVTLAQKKMAKKYVEKHLPAKSHNIAETTCFLVEGDCLEEKTLIKTVNEDGNIVDKKIKDIKINDIVITHKHQLRRVENVVHKIKDAIKIKLGNTEIICSKEHRFLVYNIETNSFEFVSAMEINLNYHKMVRSNFFDFSDGFAQIKDAKKISDGHYTIEIIMEGYDGAIQSSDNHIFVKFNTETNGIEKVSAKELKSGDFISLAKNK